MKNQNLKGWALTALIKRGFTLIELLIVVAIIAILAAIAIPNFLEAQTRSKVSRCKSDMRTTCLALSAYRIDTNAFPPHWYFDKLPQFPEILTTPIAYLQGYGTVYDIFRPNPESGPRWLFYEYSNFKFYTTNPFEPNKAGWDFLKTDPRISSKLDSIMLFSYGPNKKQDYLSYFGPYGLLTSPTDPYENHLYDPSNGTISAGDIPRYLP